MKAKWKLSLVAVMAGALALVLILGASIGTAAAPDSQLSDDLVFMGNGKGTAADGNNIKVLDIDAMAVVNTIGAGGLLANNHGVLVDGDTIWSANAALAGTSGRIVKLELGTMTQTAYDAAYGGQYASNSGLCGIEQAPSGNIWATSMSSNDSGGIYEFNKATGSTGSFVDTSAGTDNGATCGIGWNTSGSVAYTSLMTAKKMNTMSWPGGSITAELPVTGTGSLHILDVAKTANYAYVTGGNVTGVGKLAIIDLASNTQVGTVTGPAASGDWHGPTVAHSEGFLYVHSRGGSAGINPSFPGTTFIYDIGGGSAGGTKTVPALIGQISDSGTPAVSCGTDVAVKSDFCAKPALSLSKTSTYWGSYADYTAGLLSVDYSVGNSGVNAYNVAVAGTVNTMGVTMASATAVGNVPSGSSAALTIKYNVPSGVGSFGTTVYATAGDLCGNSYAYPGAYPGA
jgi:hypothetical protein